MPPQLDPGEAEGVVTVESRTMMAAASTMPERGNHNHNNHHHHPANTNGSNKSTTRQHDEDNNDETTSSTITTDYFFLTPDAARELPRFQYQGEDLSLLYKYILSPLATFCVYRLTPAWVAPNTITLIGLIFMVVAYGIMWYHVPDLVPTTEEESDEEPPRWIYLYNGVAILLYQTMDNMDGKQARRTGNGSPLGLLFDHGCDAVNNIFGSANWMISMALHPYRDVYLCFSILFGPYALFFFGTWEEYFTGKLIMPIINGPNEGLLGGAVMSFLSWWFGPLIWHETHAWDMVLYPLLQKIISFVPILDDSSWWLPSPAQGGLRNMDCLVLFATYTFIAEPASKAVFVVRNYGRQTLAYLVPFVTLVVCAAIVGVVDLNVWLDVPRTSLHLCACLFVEMTVDLMMTHMTKQPYTYLRWLLLPLVALTFLVGTGYWSAGHTTADFLLIYTSMTFTYVVCKTVVTIHEIASLLNIWCFDITTKRRPTKTKKA